MINDFQTFLWEKASERESLFSVLHKVALFGRFCVANFSGTMLFFWYNVIFLVQCYYNVILSYFEKETN